VFYSRALGLVSRGGEPFYENGTIYDAIGNCFEISGIVRVTTASLKDSIRYFQRMNRIEFRTEFIEQVNLDDFKNRIINHVRRYPIYWEMKDNLEDITIAVRNMKNFTQIISYVE